MIYRRLVFPRPLERHYVHLLLAQSAVRVLTPLEHLPGELMIHTHHPTTVALIFIYDHFDTTLTRTVFSFMRSWSLCSLPLAFLRRVLSVTFPAPNTSLRTASISLALIFLV